MMKNRQRSRSKQESNRSDRSNSVQSKKTYLSNKSNYSRLSKLSRSSITSAPLIHKGNTKIINKQKKQENESKYKAIEWNENEQKAWYDQDQVNILDYDQSKNRLYQTLNNNLSNDEKRTTSSRISFQNKQKYIQTSKWQEDRLISSGFYKRINQPQQLQEDQKKVILKVHDFKPPFISQDVQIKIQKQKIQIVKNLQSDIAVAIKKGSQLLKQTRQKNQRKKNMDRFWELGNSKLGKMIGITNKNVSITPVQKDSDLKFSDLIKKTQGSTQFTKYKTLKEQKQSLPIYQCKYQLMKLIRQNKIVIIVGQTGSGKTTQLTQYMLQEGYFSRHTIIGCTQPRRVAAVSVAKRVAQQMNTKLGDKVGYAIRFQDCTSIQTKIKYMTDGVLLRQSLNDADLQRYSVIIMDQAHQRSLNTDVLFGIVKKVSMNRKDIKIIITSATMNQEKFSNFFGRAPIFNIPGRTFPVKQEYQKSPVQDYLDAAVKKSIQIHLQQPKGDILIFMTGQQDIQATCLLIHQKLQKVSQNCEPLLILPIYSQLRSEQQARIFQSSPFRKCIVATNIAQTSLTLDGVKYVIDSGFCKLKVYNPRIGMDALQINPVSQANANQRAGRAGRTGPGTCYRLYTSTAYRNDLFQSNIPQIQRTNLSNVVLLLKSLKIEDIFKFQFMDPPLKQTIMNSMYQLWILSALDNTGRLTNKGQKMSQFPVDPPLSRMILAANEFQCLQQILTIVSMLSVPSIFFKPKDRQQQAQAIRQKFLVYQSDHITYLNIFQRWKQNEYSSQWSASHFLHQKSLKKAKEIRMQLKDISTKLGFKASSCKKDFSIIRKAICSGYFTNAAKFKGFGQFINLRTGMPCKLHPSSALFSLGYIPQYIVYHQLVLTTKQYMNCVTVVDPYWLQQLGPMFFEVKKQFNLKEDNKTKYLQQMDNANKNEKILKQQQRLSNLKQQKRVAQKGLSVVGPGINRSSTYSLN